MAHRLGNVRLMVPSIVVGPSDGTAATGPNEWSKDFTHTAPSMVTRFLMLHLGSENLLGGNKVEVKLGYDTDVFDSSDFPDDGTGIWTRPIDVSKFISSGDIDSGIEFTVDVPVTYITDGVETTGSVTIDKFGRGEVSEYFGSGTAYSAADIDYSKSNCDPFLVSASTTVLYAEPRPNTRWLCNKAGGPNPAILTPPPEWNNVAGIGAGIKSTVADSVGIIIFITPDTWNPDGSVASEKITSCSVTCVDQEHVITASHCFGANTALLKKYVALSGSVTFDYQTNAIGAEPPGYAPQFFKVTKVSDYGNGELNFDSNFLLTCLVPPLPASFSTPMNDYCILELKAPPAGIGVSPILWRSKDDPLVPGEEIFGIHHPLGAVKKISPFSFESETSPCFNEWVLRADLDMASGSSGSGVFDMAGRLVGILSHGNPCELVYVRTNYIDEDMKVGFGTTTDNHDTMVVIDISGSMAGSAGVTTDPTATKLDQAKDAAHEFVHLIRNGQGDRVGIATFNSIGDVDQAFLPITDMNKSALVGPSGAPPAGVVGGLAPGGSTSIGDGLKQTLPQFTGSGSHLKKIVLLSDGRENTDPKIADVDGLLGGIDIYAVGYGTASGLNGYLLSKLAQDHNGSYTMAASGLAVRKFFALAFGEIFDPGTTLYDPEFTLGAHELEDDEVPFSICGEDEVTILISWDSRQAALRLRINAPNGDEITSNSQDVESAVGRTWSFIRFKLPYQGQGDGVWHYTVTREIVDRLPSSDVVYFVHIAATGGPTMARFPGLNTMYTGDAINPLVTLYNDGGGKPPDARVFLTVRKPTSAVGDALSVAGLGPPTTVGGDVVPPRYSTMMGIEQSSGKPIVDYEVKEYELFDDTQHNGMFEPAALFGNPIHDLITVEGNYTFHATAKYGGACSGTREVLWSIQVEPGIDGSQTKVTRNFLGKNQDGTKRYEEIILFSDHAGHRLGPGRGDRIQVTAGLGTTVDTPLKDLLDGFYKVGLTWNPAIAPAPSLIFHQPGRGPVVIEDSALRRPRVPEWYYWIGGLLLLIVILVLILLLVV